VVQIDTNGTLFSIGDWALTAASFTGNLDDTASDITVVNAGKTTGTATPTVADFVVEDDSTNFLIGTLYNAPGGNDSLVNGAYSVILGNTGTVTLPAGGTISEGIVTSNPTIQLTPASPDVASQKLVIKGGGGEFYNQENGIGVGINNNVWEVTDSPNFYVYAPTRPDETLYWWIVPEEGGISTTMSGTVELDGNGDGVFNFTIISDAYEFRVRVSPEEDNYDPESIGVESVLMNGDAPTFGSDYHLHLTTGDLAETSIFLGTDDHNVRTTTDGKIQITTPSEGNNVWEFGTDGDLTLPAGGDIKDSNGDSVLGGEGLPTITVPATPAVLYKGLQASYGMIHSNDDDDDELNVNKIVIHKPAVTTTTIDPTSSQDDFEVSGLGASDVVAMFVVYGNANEAKPLSDLQAFAKSVIDLVILDGGVAGEYNTVDAMKTAFYDIYPTLALAANGLYTDFEFFTSEEIWPENSISDGGADQYDTANFISTNLANNINYNGGETVEDGVAAFGTGSTYTFVYDTAIFGLFATGSSATLIRTSGGSGADGDSITEAGNLFGAAVPEQTFDNAVTHLNLVGTPYAGSLITFTRTDYGDEIDEISEGLHITKNDRGWLYNALEDEGYDDNTPTGSLWNNDGWDDFSNVETRTYTSLTDIWSGNFANIPGAKMIMLDETTGKYWAVEFLSWTNNQEGGGASYTRQELDLDNVQQGIRFADGTRQTTAYIDTNVKFTAPVNRRIEEVYGYKSVSVTAKSTVNLTTTASRNSDSPGTIWIDSTTTTIDNIISDTDLAGITDTNTIEFSIDNTNWYVYNGSTNFASDERGYNVNLNGATLTYEEGDTVYFRYITGGVPVIWWNKDDLPGDSSNFRGAVIDYHAYTGDATIIGTIHIVDDDGDEHITHTEVSSGNTDSENDDLWVVSNEGDIRYRRLDGEANTLKIQWSAKVFYGSENN
jgi:hypothetical protein